MLLDEIHEIKRDSESEGNLKGFKRVKRNLKNKTPNLLVSNSDVVCREKRRKNIESPGPSYLPPQIMI
jgi:hypothetical protein